MYPSEGLAFWEIVVTSGIFAIAILALASLISVLATFLVMREPARARQPVPVPRRVEPSLAVGPTMATG